MKLSRILMAQSWASLVVKPLHVWEVPAAGLWQVAGTVTLTVTDGTPRARFEAMNTFEEGAFTRFLEDAGKLYRREVDEAGLGTETGVGITYRWLDPVPWVEQRAARVRERNEPSPQVLGEPVLLARCDCGICPAYDPDNPPRRGSPWWLPFLLWHEGVAERMGGQATFTNLLVAKRQFQRVIERVRDFIECSGGRAI